MATPKSNTSKNVSHPAALQACLAVLERSDGEMSLPPEGDGEDRSPGLDVFSPYSPDFQPTLIQAGKKLFGRSHVRMHTISIVDEDGLRLDVKHGDPVPQDERSSKWWSLPVCERRSPADAVAMCEKAAGNQPQAIPTVLLSELLAAAEEQGGVAAQAAQGLREHKQPSEAFDFFDPTEPTFADPSKFVILVTPSGMDNDGRSLWKNPSRAERERARGGNTQRSARQPRSDGGSYSDGAEMPG